MEFEGDRELLRRLFLKQRLLLAGDPRHEEIRPAALALPGILRGVYGGGQIIALEKFNLQHTFDTAVGLSTGAALMSYLLSKRSEIGTSIYHKECTTPEFMSRWKLRMDTHYISDVFRGKTGDKGLDLDTIHSCRTKLLIGVTCAETGNGMLLDAKRAGHNLVDLVQASISIPRLSRKPVSIGRGEFWDGGGAFPFPSQEVIEKSSPTDILVLANGSKNNQVLSPMLRIARKLLFKGLPEGVQEAFSPETCDRKFAHGLNFLKSSGVRYGILWSDDEIGGFERRPDRLRAATARAEAHLTSLLQEALDSIS